MTCHPVRDLSHPGHGSRRDSGVTRVMPASPSPGRAGGHRERQEDHITGGGLGCHAHHSAPIPSRGLPMLACSTAHPAGGAGIRGGQRPRRWRKPKHGVCLHKRTRRRVAVSAVPAWPDSPDLFADKGFIFLSQGCNRKTNMVKPLELLPA